VIVDEQAQNQTEQQSFQLRTGVSKDQGEVNVTVEEVRKVAQEQGEEEIELAVEKGDKVSLIERLLDAKKSLISRIFERNTSDD
jgi:hypothetical protein